jgi:hypothetical protein
MPLIPRIVSAEDAKINVLLYGRPGAGKTTLAATAADHPALSPVLFLNFEGGLLSVAARGDISAIDIKQMSDLDDVFYAYLRGDPEIARFRTIVIDSGSEMQALDLQEIVGEAMESGGRSRKSLDEIFIDDYGVSTARMKRLVRWYRDLPCNLVITALPKYIYPGVGRNRDRTADPIECVPSFTDVVARSVMGYVDFLWYQYVDDEGRRAILTQTMGIYQAKTRGTRFPVELGATVLNPNLASIYDLLISSECCPRVRSW